MNIKTIQNKIRNFDKKTIFSASIGAAIVVFGIGYMVFGKAETFAAVPTVMAPVNVTTVVVEPPPLPLEAFCWLMAVAY